MVLVLRGAGDRAFVAGTDISQFQDLRTPDDALGYESKLDRVIDRLERVQIPTIAPGSRAWPSAAAASWPSPAICASAVPAPGSASPSRGPWATACRPPNCARLLDLVGPARLKDLMYTARLLDAREALAAGLATQVVDAEGLDDAVAETAAAIAANAPLTIRATKELVRRVQRGRRPDPALAHDLIIDCYTSDDFQNAVEAFVARRAPAWSGR